MCQLLTASAASALPFPKVVIWGSENTLRQLPNPHYLQKVHVPALDMTLPYRILWQQLSLPKELRNYNCRLLFSPGGTAPLFSEIPTVVMSQNLLPFSERSRGYYSVVDPFRLKMALLRVAQVLSMRKAKGLVFLTEHARGVISEYLGDQNKAVKIIPHGLDDRFFLAPGQACPSTEFSAERPFRILYVSILDNYKHQIEVARAVGSLRAKGLPLQVSFVGPRRPSYHSRLVSVMSAVDPQGQFLFYEGEVDYSKLHARYRMAELSVFASSCENLPNILLEAMASGVPVISSSVRPMPDVLGEAGVYFDPESPEEIAVAIEKVFYDAGLRTKMAARAFERARSYSWGKCSSETFDFLCGIAKQARQG